MKTAAAFKELDAWQQAMHLVEHIYKVTAAFPTRKWRRASNSLVVLDSFRPTNAPVSKSAATRSEDC
jgi:hypothetical protein